MWFSVINFVYLYTVKPLETRKENLIELINEFCILECAYIYNIFVRGEGTLEFLDNMGWVFLGISAFNILCNLSFVILDTTSTFWQNGKSKLDQRRVKKMMDYR